MEAIIGLGSPGRRRPLELDDGDLEEARPMQMLVDRRDLGLRLQLLRISRRWKLTDVSERTGIPTSTLSRWERGSGKHYPDLERLMVLAELYGVNVNRLLSTSGSLGFDPRGRGSKKRPQVSSAVLAA